MKQTNILLTLLFCLTITACDTQEKADELVDLKYFDLVGLLDNQLDILVNSNASLEKIVGAGEEEEKLEIEPSKEGWREELKLFYGANINKLGLKDAYNVEELSRIGGGKKLINTAKSSGQTVRLLEYNYSEIGLESLRILIEEKNEVFVFQKEMLMSFALVNNEIVLSDYSIIGKQEMILKDDLDFALKGKIVMTP